MKRLLIIFLLASVFLTAQQEFYKYEELEDGYRVEFEENVYWVAELPMLESEIYVRDNVYITYVRIYYPLFLTRFWDKQYFDDKEIQNALYGKAESEKGIRGIKEKLEKELLRKWFKYFDDDNIGWELIE